MRFIARVWTTVTTITQYFGVSPLADHGIQQQPVGSHSHSSIKTPNVFSGAPLFEPPGSNIKKFTCDYTAMGSQWVNCTETTGCWLRNTKTGEEFNVSATDYEKVAPVGIMRNYTLIVTDRHNMNRDGICFTEGKLFNGTFPGPLLEACWGDTLNITVINKSTFNGTSIHWHGIRQNQTMQMDGVNGITQCPIAPGDSFNYIWKADQYGSSWYHSHYSVQYADGLQAPITIHGPTSLAYDEAIEPLITSDWLHNSAFEAIYTFNPSWPTLLLNGAGNCARMFNSTNRIASHCDPTSIPPGFEMTFNPVESRVAPGRRRRYLLRIINTSFSTSIRFSIDNHYLSVVEADFVPVKNTTKVESILVAIGQRYHVIVEADPQGPNIPLEQNFWIRTNSSGCGDDVLGDDAGYERTGILRYVGAPKTEPKSQPWPGNLGINTGGCLDTLSPQLEPAYSWTVQPPKNGPTFGGTTNRAGETLEVKADFSGNTPYALGHFALNRQHSNKFIPFQTTYGNPTLLNLDNFDDNSDTDREPWPAGWVVVPENFTSEDYVYLVLVGQGHPIHLHGHDFAIVEYNTKDDFCPSLLHPPYNNPMRRDVVLLPVTPNNKGFVVIAFKTDNPGAWLMHCHIALHASWGLSLQIMERQSTANSMWPPGSSTTLMRARRTCAKWNSWAYDCRNAWPGLVNGAYPACVDNTALQGDSGI